MQNAHACASNVGGAPLANFVWAEPMGPTGVQFIQGTSSQGLKLSVPGSYVFTLTAEFDGGGSSQASAVVHVLGSTPPPSLPGLPGGTVDALDRLLNAKHLLHQRVFGIP
jgi:hypothetical protein